MKRHRRWIAAVLVAVSTAFAAYGATPLAATHCECAHGPEVDCDCPHHQHAEPDDASLPPCHRAQKHTKNGSAAGKTGFRSKCGSSHAELTLLPLAVLAEPVMVQDAPQRQQRIPAGALAEVDIEWAPARRPPRG